MLYKRGGGCPAKEGLVVGLGAFVHYNDYNVSWSSIKKKNYWFISGISYTGGAKSPGWCLNYEDKQDEHDNTFDVMFETCS